MIGALLLLFASVDQARSPGISVGGSASTAFAAPEPAAPATRELWKMDTIVLLPPSDLASLRALTDDHTMDAVAAHLGKMGVKYLRGPTKFYPALFPAELIKAVRALPAHEPFVLPNISAIFIYDVVSISQEDVPPTPAAAPGQ
ncbi:MAG TPA: hypothetical protein VNT42_03620 [Sphingomonas sp.]|nr:hypothetical protein [Sphingomonas sp.]